MRQLNPAPLFKWANARERIRIQKDAGAEQPDWTNDPIFQTYRFCNVYREQDRVTKWVHENIRNPYQHDPNLWFLLLITRLINWPPTIQELIDGHAFYIPQYSPDHYDGGLIASILDTRKARGDKVYTGAYMVRAESATSQPWYNWTKQEYVAKIVFKSAWDHWETHSTNGCDVIGGTMQAFTEGLSALTYGVGPFVAYQVAVDLSWCPGWLTNAADLNTWAAVGPGSRRGLNRLADDPVKASLSQEQAVEEMNWVHSVQEQYLADWMKPIRLSDIQNCLCETDKYIRVLNNEGRPRARYIAGRGS